MSETRFTGVRLPAVSFASRAGIQSKEIILFAVIRNVIPK